jgi:hypothetical protein
VGFVPERRSEGKTPLNLISSGSPINLGFEKNSRLLVQISYTTITKSIELFSKPMGSLQVRNEGKAFEKYRKGISEKRSFDRGTECKSETSGEWPK